LNVSVESAVYLSPPVYSEIEVLWEITSEDGVVEAMWCKAVVQASEYKSGRREAILLYDSHEEFEEEVVRVRFTTGTQLVDIGRESGFDGGVMKLRLYGSSCHDTDSTATDAMEADGRTVSGSQEAEITAELGSLANGFNMELKEDPEADEELKR